MVYSNAHRFLLRTIASQGVISFKNFMQIFGSLKDFTDTSIETVINDINKVIKPYEQNIKIVIDELTSEKKLVFVCLGSKSQNMFSKNELDYFRILIEKIMTTENREIDINTALNLADEANPTLKKIDANVILKTWCKLHYLDKNDTCYALGIRAIHEFERYLQENMPDTIQNCFICEKIVFRGVNCPACDNSIHTRCLNVHLKTVKKWPCCKVHYTGATNDATTELLNSTMLPETQLLQTQQIHGNLINEPMDISEIPHETERINISRSRKRRRVSSD